MFRVEVFCETKNLGRLYEALVGLTIGEPKAQPVANAELKNGKVAAKTNGDTVEMLMNFLNERKLSEFRPVHMHEFAKSAGLAGYGSVLSRAVERGLIKKSARSKGKNTIYNTTKKGGA